MIAERRQFLTAGAVTGLALLTRPTAAALLPARALSAGHERDRLRALASLAIAPLLFAAYPLYLWIAEDDPWQFLHAQRLWSRHLSPAGPLGGIWDGLRAGWAGVEQLASGSHTHVYWTPVQDADPIRVAVLNLEALAFLGLFVVLAVIAWRRFEELPHAGPAQRHARADGHALAHLEARDRLAGQADLRPLACDRGQLLDRGVLLL